MLNLITDVAGISVGCAHDLRLMSGVTTILFHRPVVASVSVLGGAPAGRDLGCLEPDAAVEAIDAIVLSGGSGFGLDSASGAQAWLREQGRGFQVGSGTSKVSVPIVPSAVCFDLLNGGDKGWGRYSPYLELGYAATADAGQRLNNGGIFELGSVGAGCGASTVSLKGGLGSASDKTRHGHTVAAIVIVNALGSAVVGDGPHFWAAPLEQDAEFGGLGRPSPITAEMRALTWKGHVSTTSIQPATTLACVATDARLDKAQAKRLAIAANAGLGRGLRIAHALMDGDTVFAASTGARPLSGGLADLIEIGAMAADCLARAIARAVYQADIPSPNWVGPPSWKQKFSAFTPVFKT